MNGDAGTPKEEDEEEEEDRAKAEEEEEEEAAIDDADGADVVTEEAVELEKGGSRATAAGG